MASYAKKDYTDVPPYLYKAYQQLRRSDLVMRHDIDAVPSDEAMKQFAFILNGTVSKDEYHKGQRSMILKLVHATKSSELMIRLLNDKRHDMEPYILWTSGPLIAAHFGLEKYVTISFNKKHNVYFVRRFGTAPPRNKYRSKYPPQHSNYNTANGQTVMLDEDEEDKTEISPAVAPVADGFMDLIEKVRAAKAAAIEKAEAAANRSAATEPSIEELLGVDDTAAAEDEVDEQPEEAPTTTATT